MAKKHVKTHIVHHHDGSHTVHRHYKHDDGSESKESSAHHNLDGVHDTLQDHLGTPNPGEAEANAGQHGIAPDVAGPAGIPAAPTPGGQPPMSGAGA